MFSRVLHSIAVVRRAWLVPITIAVATTAASAQTTVRSIGASTVADEAVVTIEASGVLPPPTVGALDGPPRIFLDFAGVRAGTSGLARTRDPRVRRVRVATNSASPLVTRVVIDLVTVLPHRVELAAGRAVVFIGAGAPLPAAPSPARGTIDATRPPAATAAPIPALPPPMPDANDLRSAPRLPSSSSPSSPSSSSSSSSGAATAAPKLPYRPPATPPPARDIEKYRAQVNPLLERLKLQMPLLEEMESLEEELAARMPMAILEFDRLRDELGVVKPPETLRGQHDLLVQAARLATTAARLRLESVQTGNAAQRRNAASAAAGATLMLDRVFAELGFSVDR
jgi:hypothetical protein